MSCGVGCRHGSDPALLWLWCRLAAAAPIGPLAWESPYATAVALKDKKTNNNNDDDESIVDLQCCANFYCVQVLKHIKYSVREFPSWRSG